METKFVIVSVLPVPEVLVSRKCHFRREISLYCLQLRWVPFSSNFLEDIRIQMHLPPLG